MSPIRVSFVIDTLSRAGTESQLLALIRNVDRTRVEPTLVLLNGDDPASQSLEPTDCRVIRLGVRKLTSATAFRAAATLRRHWTRERPDVVQAYFLDSAYFAIPVAKLAGVRNIVRVRNNLGYWLTRKHRLLNRVFQPFVRSTLTNSDEGRQRLQHERAGRVDVIENGVDLPSTAVQSRGAYSIATVANLRPVKNIDGLLRAAALVMKRCPHAHFHIAGDGPERGSLQALRQSLALTNHVSFHGSRSDIPAFLATNRVAVLPSHSEGMSNALLEMMAAGCAIVATNVGANAKVLADTGIIVPPKNDEALAQALLQLVNDTPLSERLGLAARLRVEQHYSRASMCRRFEDYYESLTRSRAA